MKKEGTVPHLFGAGILLDGFAQLTKNSDMTQRGRVRPNLNLLDDPVIIRAFWQYVKKGRGRNACWFFARVEQDGYGVFRKTGAHRISWQIHRGPIPPTLHVLHKCDVRNCVRPTHLFLGTDRDNVWDAIQKGRPFGTRTWTPEQRAERARKGWATKQARWWTPERLAKAEAKRIAKAETARRQAYRRAWGQARLQFGVRFPVRMRTFIPTAIKRGIASRRMWAARTPAERARIMAPARRAYRIAVANRRIARQAQSA